MNIILTKTGGFWIAHTEQGEPLGCARNLETLIAALLGREAGAR